MHRGGGYYCVHIAACALFLSLDGSVCPRQGVGAPSRGSKKGGPLYFRPGAAVKKGLHGMKGGMGVIGNNNGR